MGHKRHLAFDFGAESGRAIVGTLENGVLEMEEIHRFPTGSMFVYDSLRWNIYRLYEEILTGLRKYVQRYGDELESLGVDTWGVDYAFLKEDGAIFEVPYQYRDDRTQGTAEVIRRVMGERAVYDITGIQFMNINTLNQLIAQVRNSPADFGQAKEMLFIGDTLHYLLSGEKAAEFTVASTSQMLDAIYKTWSEDIFSAFGIPAHLQPRIVFAGDILGELSQSIADLVGLRTPVRIAVPAVHDTASAAAAIPARGTDWAYISSGTWCMVGLETDTPVITDLSYEMNISNSGGALGRNLFLKNVMGLWIIQQCRRTWEERGMPLSYPQIVERALAAPPFAAFIDPDDDLFFAPTDSIEAVSEYLGKTEQEGVDVEDVGTVARMVYEALALKYRYVLERLVECTDKKVNALHVIGGGSKNELLNQFTADAIGIPVYAGPGEATAMGNLMLQAYACGELRSIEEVRAAVRASSVLPEFLPNRASRKAWDKAYADFCRICGLK